MAIALLQDELFPACAGSAPEEAVLHAAFPCAHVAAMAATACPVPSLLDPAAALGRHPPCRMQLQCSDLVASFLQGVPCAVRTCQPPVRLGCGEPSPS